MNILGSMGEDEGGLRLCIQVYMEKCATHKENVGGKEWRSGNNNHISVQ